MQNKRSFLYFIRYLLKALFIIVFHTISFPQNIVASLDGDGDYIEIPHSTDYRPTNFITLESWFKLYDQITPDQCFRIISNTHAGGWAFAYNNWNFPEFDNNSIRFTININNTYYRPKMDSLETLDLPQNEWIHMAGTYDGEKVILYINGYEEDIVPASGPITYTYNNSLLFGAEAGYYDYPSPDGAFYFHGEIDEIRIWNIARTQQEIISTMNSTLAGNEDNLIGYWNFDNGTANDATTNDNHGNIYGDTELIVSYDLIYCDTYNDVNGDGDIDVMDVLLTVDYVLGRDPEYFNRFCSDCNSDGYINILDIICIINEIYN